MEAQLTFEGLVNPSVPLKDEDRLSHQNLIVYKRLKRGPTTNVELANLTKSMAVHSRVSDVRQEIQQNGYDLKPIASNGGIRTYAIISPNGTIYPLGIKPEDYEVG